MSTTWNEMSDAPLFVEHCLLGGVFEEHDDPLLVAPLHYGDPNLLTAFTEGCALSDLSGMTGILLTGRGVEDFVTTACAYQPLAVGDCAFEAVLAGDGSLTAIPLVARTGNEEYLVLDVSSHGLALQPWLGFLSAIEQQGFRPFGDVVVEDVSDSLVPLLLWGPQAAAILADYVPAVDMLPTVGHVASIDLDRIPCIVACLPIDDKPCYLVMVPPQAARVLWRSFLSFTVLSPVGTAQIARHATTTLPWMAHALRSERLTFAFEQLLDWGLVRSEGGYVGHRALQNLGV